MLHHLTEISADNGVTWSVVTLDEASGPDKTAILTGLGGGSYQVKLRITPTAGGTAVLSAPVTLTVTGGNTYTEAVTALVESGVSASAAQAMQEALQVAATVQTSVTDQASTASSYVESCLVSVNAAATVTDARAMIETLTAQITALATTSDSRAAVEALTAAASSVVTTTDLTMFQESLTAAINALATVSDTMPSLLWIHTLGGMTEVSVDETNAPNVDCNYNLKGGQTLSFTYVITNTTDAVLSFSINGTGLLYVTDGTDTFTYYIPGNMVNAALHFDFLCTYDDFITITNINIPTY